MGINCQEAVVLCGCHGFDKTLLQCSLGGLEGLRHLQLLFEDRVTEGVEDIVELLFDPSFGFTVSGTINVLINLSHHFCSIHGIQMSRKCRGC